MVLGSERGVVPGEPNPVIVRQRFLDQDSLDGVDSPLTVLHHFQPSASNCLSSDR